MKDQIIPGPDVIQNYLAFFGEAGKLKDTLRSARTGSGKRESTAEHTWRLCLMALTLKDRLEGLDFCRLVEMLIVHDLAEAVTGDIPATEQTGDKSGDERAAMTGLLADLPPETAARLMGIWEDYNAVRTPEARLAKGLDRLETVLQHVEGKNAPDFDYGFNLGYGHEHTDRHPLIAALRGPVDDETRRRAGTGLTGN